MPETISLIPRWKTYHTLRRADGRPLFAPPVRPNEEEEGEADIVVREIPEFVHENHYLQDTQEACSCEVTLRPIRRRQKIAEAITLRTSYRLLRRHLSPQQLDEFREHKHFHVVTKSGRRLRIAPKELVIEFNENNEQIARYCIHPVEPLPAGDVMLSQKFLLEAEEEMFFKIAIDHGVRGFDDIIEVRDLTDEEHAVYMDMETYGGLADHPQCPDCFQERNTECANRYHLYRLIHLQQQPCAHEGCIRPANCVYDVTRLEAWCNNHRPVEQATNRADELVAA